MRACKFYSVILLICLGLFPATAREAGAFSFSGLDIKSKFGDPFWAEALVLNDGKAGLKVEIGSSADYSRLGLERRQAVENLLVDENLVPAGSGKQLVRIYSKKPLFYPSFELVLKATLEGNSIIDSFFLAVNFQTNLSIGVVEKKKEKKPEEEKTPPKAPASLIAANVPEAPKEGEILPRAEKTPPSEEVKSVEETKPQEAKSTEIVEKDLHADKSGEKPPIKETPQPEKETEKVEEIEKKPASLPSAPPVETPAPPKAAPLLTVKTRLGDNLFKVAQGIVKNKKSLNRAVASLWTINKEKFPNGNINFIKAGTELDYTGLAEKMAGISERDARIILRKQAEEANLLKHMARDKEKAGGDQGPLLETSLPGELDPSQGEIQKITKAWLRDWEGKDLENYISHYSKLFQAKGKEGTLSLADWKERKRKTFETQQGVSIKAADFQVRPERDHFQGSFFLAYHSDKADSVGLKTLDFAREEGAWKIFREGFEKTDLALRKGPRRFPYVVDIGTFQDLGSALEKSNYLRRLCYSSYIVTVKVPGNGNYYRVAIDRFSTKEEADEFAAILIRLGVIPNAVSLELPYALEIGAFDSAPDAFRRIMELGVQGFSAYLLTVSSGPEGDLAYKALAGAYETRQHAENFSTVLKSKGTDSLVVEP
ncbi:MAG: SPOR domain-containing protein [Nitrospinae bacterium]|nr:SPOR domain-containing protein [Nitrospinota bacterium]